MDALPDGRPPTAYVIVASALIFDESGRAALVRNRGRWWLPGGRVEAGETMFEAARREAAEETGLAVEPARIVSVTERVADRHEIFATIQCRYVSGTLTLPESDPKIDAVRWAEADEVAELLHYLPIPDLAAGVELATDYRVERVVNLAGMAVHVYPTPRDVARVVADHVEQSIADLAGPATLGLAGGGTPRLTYAQLQERPIAWEDVTMWLGDERWVAHNHPESNVGMVRAELVDAVNGQLLAPNHAIGDPHTAAAAYETALMAAFVDRGRGKAPDTVLLGIGDDGHTASLFPNTAALDSTSAGYLANWVETKDAWRLTATLPLLWAAGELVFIVTGGGKAQVVKEMLIDQVPYPAQRAASGAARATWYLDEAAASQLGDSSS